MKRFQKPYTLLLLALVLPVLLYPAKRLTIVHINDTHGQIEPIKAKDGREYGGFARVAYVVDSLRNEAEENNNPLLFLHAGDALQGPPISNMSKGKLDFELLNRMDLDAMVAGNHEFDFGQDNLESLESEAEFELLSANVLDEAGNFLFERYIESKAGRNSVLLVGLTTPATPSGTHPENVKGLVFTSPDTAMADNIQLLEYGEEDLIIALTHQGVYYDSLLALKVPEIDLIVGGHSHTVLEQPREINNALVVQAGASTLYVGKFDAKVKRGEITDWEYELILLADSIPEDTGIAKRIAAESKLVDEKIAQPLGKTEVSLVPGFCDKRDELSLGNLLARLIKEETGADFAFTNAGGVRASIHPGDVSLKNILTALPFNNTIVTMELTAEQVRQVLSTDIAHGPHSGGTLHLAGITYETENDSVVNINIEGNLLDESRTYRIATNNFLAAGGDGYEVLKQGCDFCDTGTAVNAVLASYVERKGTITGR
ncbi:hypothetical protein GF359_03690 [candidate division WOR-3 bacterium]|uniref:Bifunctional metallophosphatase/5'-nucleotidase n=1 Tax=candidate division WOR-3 bacterium TaxID=2052148 RepID=A0A9D5K8J8_UNCW3|nr:hypothetical protein [candidate division WOR-3 bacterium]MBD3364298.1 hypothetical protein [candidate division WOR-3 bacterium]